jgi:phosphoenolpyruvate synthase/pyruvate phosphate dikinase
MMDPEKIEWHVWHRRKRTPFLIYFMFHGASTRPLKRFDHSVKEHGSCVDYIITRKSVLEDFRQKLWERFKTEPGFILQSMKDAYEQQEKDKEQWQALLAKDFSELSNTELSTEYTRYIERVLRYGGYIYTPLAIEPLLAQEVEKVLGDNKEDHDVVMTPVNESEMIEERKSLLRMAVSKDLSGMKEHVERFSFLKKKGMFMEFFDDAHYKEEIEKCSSPEDELEKLEQDSESKKRSFQELLDRFPDDAYAQALLKTTNEAIFFRTWRTERIIQSSFYIVPLFKEIASRIGLSDHHDVLYVLPDELAALLEKDRGADKELIAQRKDAFVMLILSEETLMLQGNDAKELLGRMKFTESKSDEVKGTPAFRGKVKGKVVVVQGPEDYEKIAGCEVLVAHATVPDMVPYLDGVKGIVTEEGGILSHAAVISREMKKVCVIGTGNCTSVLKDGDVVEVDAEEGVVRKK